MSILAHLYTIHSQSLEKAVYPSSLLGGGAKVQGLIYHNSTYTRVGNELTTLVVIGNGCIGTCKSNFQIFMAATQDKILISCQSMLKIPTNYGLDEFFLHFTSGKALYLKQEQT